MSELQMFDSYLNDDGPAAIVIREHLMPVEGPDSVVFPATFAAAKEVGFQGGYNIDGTANERRIALIDTVGSQANRTEELFLLDKYRHLVPQISVTAGDHEVSILEAGHRAGDAIVRCSSLQEELHNAFKAVLKGDASALATVAPTSLVFGVWDSRDTQAKLPRVVASTIRAFDVRELTRGAVYTPPVNYAELDVFSEEEKEKAEGDNKSPLAKRGFVHVPASGSHGGVIADGGIRRDATLGLAALRLLKAGKDNDRTLALRRYILGLALVAFTYRANSYLRQGCMLVLNPDKASENEFAEVYPDGRRVQCTITADVALNYATEAAKAFGVGESRTVPFDRERAKKDVKGEGDAKKTGKRKAKKEAVSEATDE